MKIKKHLFKIMPAALGILALGLLAGCVYNPYPTYYSAYPRYYSCGYPYAGGCSYSSQYYYYRTYPAYGYYYPY